MNCSLCKKINTIICKNCQESTLNVKQAQVSQIQIKILQKQQQLEHYVKQYIQPHHIKVRQSMILHQQIQAIKKRITNKKKTIQTNQLLLSKVKQRKTQINQQNNKCLKAIKELKEHITKKNQQTDNAIQQLNQIERQFQKIQAKKLFQLLYTCIKTNDQLQLQKYFTIKQQSDILWSEISIYAGKSQTVRPQVFYIKTQKGTVPKAIQEVLKKQIKVMHILSTIFNIWMPHHIKKIDNNYIILDKFFKINLQDQKYHKNQVTINTKFLSLFQANLQYIFSRVSMIQRPFLCFNQVLLKKLKDKAQYRQINRRQWTSNLQQLRADLIQPQQQDEQYEVAIPSKLQSQKSGDQQSQEDYYQILK